MPALNIRLILPAGKLPGHPGIGDPVSGTGTGPVVIRRPPGHHPGMGILLQKPVHLRIPESPDLCPGVIGGIRQHGLIQGPGAAGIPFSHIGLKNHCMGLGHTVFHIDLLIPACFPPVKQLQRQAFRSRRQAAEPAQPFPQIHRLTPPVLL